jgi:hypothetical protein
VELKFTGPQTAAVGSDVHFNSGEFAPGSKEGDKLLAHELTHVVQGQKSGVERKPEDGEEKTDEKADGDTGEDKAGEEVSDPDEPAEKEADATADPKSAGELQCVLHPLAPTSFRNCVPYLSAQRRMTSLNLSIFHPFFHISEFSWISLDQLENRSLACSNVVTSDKFEISTRLPTFAFCVAGDQASRNGPRPFIVALLSRASLIAPSDVRRP